MSGLRSALGLTLIILAGGCKQFPRDPEGTLKRVEDTDMVRVGLVASHKARPMAERQFIDEVAKAAGARAAIEVGPAEAVLDRLEEGQLDLVVGEFHPTSPWSARVTFIPDLTKLEDRKRTITAAAARNGENGWITLLHRHARLLKGRRP